MSLPSVSFIYPASARAGRIKGLAAGDSPKDFFYGYTRMLEKEYPCSIVDSQRDPDGMIPNLLMKAQRARSGLMTFGINTQRVSAIAGELSGKDIALSFTDSFSLSMGLYRNKIHNRPVLVGGFHGLTDMAEMARPGFRWIAHSIVRRALDGLDHLFFFGPADQARAIEIYGQPPAKTSLYPFGIDLDYWSPSDAPNTSESGVIFSVGSDPKRDYATLLKAPIDGRIRLITRLDINIPEGNNNVELLRGNLYGSAITDADLRELYRTADIVVVPLLDVWQPTGYSVTLQAMACGKAVVLSDIRGLWDRDVFVSGHNCLLIPPGDPQALGEAVKTLQNDPDLKARIGAEARMSAEKFFPLSRMEDAVEEMVLRLLPS